MSIHVITLFVEDLLAAKSFYQEIFGLSTVYEDEESAVFNFDNMSSAEGGLIGKATEGLKWSLLRKAIME